MFAARSTTIAIAAALLTTAVASPAEARHRDRHYRRGGSGISLGDVVLGTIAVAGVATVVGALGSGRRADRRYEDRGNDGYYNGRYDGSRYGDDRQASVEACAYEAERKVGGRFGGQAQVREIANVERSRNGYRVRGTVEVLEDERYRDGYARGVERVQFTCATRGDRVVDLNVGSYYAQGY